MSLWSVVHHDPDDGVMRLSLCKATTAQGAAQEALQRVDATSTLESCDRARSWLCLVAQEAGKELELSYWLVQHQLEYVAVPISPALAMGER